MRAVHQQRPDLSVVFDPADRLITKIQDSYGSGTDPLIEVRKRAGLYVLDDLGREKDTTDALRTICTILEEREGAPTVITSNALPRALGDRAKDADLWARVASRLGDEVYRYVAVEGRDRRFAA
jgi:DNA replication protein DnaC